MCVFVNFANRNHRRPVIPVTKYKPLNKIRSQLYIRERVRSRNDHLASLNGENRIRGKGCSNASEVVADNFIGNRACTLQPANANCFGHSPEKNPAIEILYGHSFGEQKFCTLFLRARLIRTFKN